MALSGGTFVLIQAPGHVKNGKLGVVQHGPGDFLGTYSVEVDYQRYGFAPHELVELKRIELEPTPALNIDHQSSSYRVTVYHSALEDDLGKPVVQIDGIGPVRVNLNDAPIWDGDTDTHEHTQCACVRQSTDGKE